MLRDIGRFSQSPYDLLVVGGGINGAAIAHIAAGQGLRVALLEKGDFASGTSSKSTKLIHGGIRYLENFEFDLVYESLRERLIQLQTAPHLVKPLGFLIPVYEGDRRPLWMMRFGVFLYDLLAGPFKVNRHQSLSREEIGALEPNLKKDGLTGGVIYYDAQMDDARLCLENVLMADAYGAHVANYVGVRSFIKQNHKAAGVIAEDLLTHRTFEVHAKKIICAVGPWTNEILRLDDPHAKKKIRTTKGIHIVYRGAITQRALLITSKSDKRIFFVIPWMGNSLIGTTDTDYIASPDQVKVDQEDVDYLLTEAKRILPGLELTRDKIIATFAGLRPLIRKGGSATKVSRKHLFHESLSGILFVVGGKYTTYRQIAVDCVKRVCRFKRRGSFRVYGSGTIPEKPIDVAREYGIGIEVIRELMERYGTRYKDVLKIIDDTPAMKEKISDHPPVIRAQIVYAVRNEMAQIPEDITMRRLTLNYLGHVSEKCQKAIEETIQSELKTKD